MNPVREISELRKSYGDHTVLKGISFQVMPGEIFALLGGNGAGKTTALECIEGLRSYDGGNITVRGKKGIQLQSASLPSHIKPMEAIQLFAKWNRTPVDYSILNVLEIDKIRKKQYMELSIGQKRRLHLALALVGRPDILFLDEPTAGLDVEGRASLHDYIRKLKTQGKTVVLASHDMTEIENLCDRIGILNDGRLSFFGTIPELTEQFGRRYIISIKTEQGTKQFETDHIGNTMLALLEDYRNRNITVLDIKIDQGTLEEHFIRMTGGKKE